MGHHLLKRTNQRTVLLFVSFSDLNSRKIVGWEVWERETAEHASELIKRIYREEKLYVKAEPLVLHSDNGSPMKGATMLETLYNLGIIPSRSRPRVSNDNPYAESLFKTLKYVPNFQPNGFETITAVRLWVKSLSNGITMNIVIAGSTMLHRMNAIAERIKSFCKREKNYMSRQEPHIQSVGRERRELGNLATQSG